MFNTAKRTIWTSGSTTNFVEVTNCKTITNTPTTFNQIVLDFQKGFKSTISLVKAAIFIHPLCIIQIIVQAIKDQPTQ